MCELCLWVVGWGVDIEKKKSQLEKTSDVTLSKNTRGTNYADGKVFRSKEEDIAEVYYLQRLCDCDEDTRGVGIIVDRWSCYRVNKRVGKQMDHAFERMVVMYAVS